MKFSKPVQIGAAVLVVGAIVLTWMDRSNIEPKVKAKIEREATDSTQTPIRMGSIKLALKSGFAGFSNVTVGNPRGFFSLQAMLIPAIEAKIEPNTASGDGPILIHQLVLDKPQVTYEVTITNDVNLATIQHNLAAYSGGLNAPSLTPGRRIIIEDLVINEGTITISDPHLKRPDYTLPLPSIHLTNLGKHLGGFSYGQTADEILGKICADASRIAVADITRQIGPPSLENQQKGGISDDLHQILGH